MRRQTKVAVVAAAVLAVAAVVLGLVSQSRLDENEPVAAASAGEDAVVRDESRTLGEPASTGVTFVEFLDFECEACRAAFPIVEGLREEYAGDVTFVIRYFPLPGHFNAERAARAVESAARQGELEAMYTQMYETQSMWGESREPQDELFRSFAEDLGLDMQQYDADYTSEEVADRVQRDVEDGRSLGVQGTPTFFVDGEPFLPETVEDFTEVLDEALAG
ncbi:protein-disulfide isomerase [Nocardioides salarius]|uniref:Protein-disulfide isomerase n=1 Tax=Nocardioides salarius TaxID=374513 RepID=A0ABS2MEB0_9ACTN|nr:thioredoxin domain-containing protein [Nocardioides salarius]MBM7509523.1 protein-disulfide isomerase [Nocardioides salarius]